MTETDKELVITRHYKAPVSKVFEAWTRAEIPSRWFIPKDIESCEAEIDPREIDLREEGRYTITLNAPGGKVHTARGKYIKIVPNKELLFTWGWEGADSPETRVMVEFEGSAEYTMLTLTHSNFVDDKLLEHHREGWTDCVESLGQFLLSY